MSDLGPLFLNLPSLFLKQIHAYTSEAAVSCLRANQNLESTSKENLFVSFHFILFYFYTTHLAEDHSEYNNMLMPSITEQ